MAKHNSPFKDNNILRTQISVFLSDYGAVFNQQAKRTSAFFELAVYNDIVKFYEANGYIVSVENIKKKTGDFTYALSPNAKPEKCSYFLATKQYKKKPSISFEVRHNLRIQSAHSQDIFMSPDYAVVNQGAIKSVRLARYYNAKADYAYVEADSIQTFAEAKHYQPSPELILNFVGLVNEILPSCLEGTHPTSAPKHLGPSLFISGTGNPHTKAIGQSLLGRYSINTFQGMFAYPSQAYSAKNQSNLCKLGSR